MPAVPKIVPVRLRGNALRVLRFECFKRDNFRCVKCGRAVSFSGTHPVQPPMHMAHIKGRGVGGADELSNVETLCPTCHLVGKHNPKSVPRKSA